MFVHVCVDAGACVCVDACACVCVRARRVRVRMSVCVCTTRARAYVLTHARQPPARTRIRTHAGATTQRWGILWRKLQCDFQLQPHVISLCMKLHNYCNRDARDHLRATRSERPDCDNFFDMRSERARRGEQRPGGSVGGRCQPRSRVVSGGGDRLPPLSAVRVYMGAPPGWRPPPKTSMGNMTGFRDQCVTAFTRLKLKRPTVRLATARNR